MTELETKIEAEAPGFADELCDELSDEALDRTEEVRASGYYSDWCIVTCAKTEVILTDRLPAGSCW